MMTRQVARLVSATLCAVLVSCTPHVDLKIFNNTGVDLLVLAEWYGGEPETFEIANGKSLVVPARALRTCVVRSLDWNFDFREVNPPGEFARSYRIGIGYFYVLQLEQDGRVFLLAPSQRAPTSAFVDQPPGFPLRPVTHATSVGMPPNKALQLSSHSPLQSTSGGVWH